MIKVKSSKFVTSASSSKNAPASVSSEVAFLGRSNVGKSTLINEVLESNLAKSSSTPGKTKLINFFATQWEKVESKDELSGDFGADFGVNLDADLALKSDAKSSQNPNPNLKSNAKSNIDFREDFGAKSSVVLDFCLIDLPGIGYAKVSKVELKAWQKNLWEFISTRKSIKLFLHLVDSRHTDLAIDSMLESTIKSLLNADQQYLRVFTKADKLSKNDLAKLHQKNSQNNAIIMAYNDKIPQKYGGKSRLKEAIFNGILGLESA